MKKRKPYYIIIAALCFASVINIFLPYLKLPDREPVSGSSVLDTRTAALKSRVVNRIAKDEGVEKAIIYDVAKSIVSNRPHDRIVRDLTEDQYYIVDIVSFELDKKAAELEKAEIFNETDFTFFGIIKLSVNIIKELEQDLIDSMLVIACVISTLILTLTSGIYMLVTKGLKKYGTVRRLSILTVLLSLLGLVSSNAISIGALQVKEFFTANWGYGFFTIIILNILVWLTATVASYHQKVEGFVTWRMIVRQKQLIIMTIPFIIYGLIFYYGPLVGWTMAFQRFKPSAENQLWIAWDKFKFLFTSEDFLQVFRNTIAMSLINLVFSFFFAIAFALLLNEVKFIRAKKLVQTISYLPHFLSWIIVAGIVRDVLAMETGIVNELLIRMNLISLPINFFAHPKYFWWIIGFAVVWKETGWNSIIYLATMTAINPDLYEAAAIDGAGRFKKMLHITLPGIRSTIFVLLIINLGFLINSGFEAQYLLGGDLNRATSQVIDLFVLRYTFGAGVDFSLGTAAGMFKSAVSIILIFIANSAAKAAGQERLF